MNEKIEQILSIPKSLYVCMRLMPMKQAFRIPIFVRYNVRCLSLKGHVSCYGRTGSIKIGFGHVGVFDKTYERSSLQIDGSINLDNSKGSIFFGHGSRIVVSHGASLEIGAGFSNTAMMTIVCGGKIQIGERVTTSWNTLIMDTDFHETINLQTGGINPSKGEVVVGNDVWLCTRSVVLKDTNIPNGCIVGANAVITKKFTNENTLLAGNPASEKKHSITIYNSKVQVYGEKINA